MAEDTLRDVVRFYTEVEEETRLDSGSSQLECDRTKELLRRFLPLPPASVVDVGGGAGAYSFWLAELGYQVHLVDVTPRLADVARARNARAASRLASITVGDARRLSFEEASADAVLLLGPLYHLTERTDRLAALREAERIVRPNGVVCVAGVSRCAGTLDGLALHPTLDVHIVSLRHRAVADGQYRNDTGDPRYFTTAYFHRPEELAQEVSAAGLGEVEVFGIEGPGWLLADFNSRWQDAQRREDILRVARLLEAEPSIRGASAHLLAVGRRPVNRRS